MFPKISCGGFSPENCTFGYTGIKWGVCSIGFYREKVFCTQCGEVWSVRLRLAIAVVFFGIVFIGFVLLSSTKVHHIASIAIIASFVQVISFFGKFDINWSASIGGSVSAASNTQFKFRLFEPTLSCTQSIILHFGEFK